MSLRHERASTSALPSTVTTTNPTDEVTRQLNQKNPPDSNPQHRNNSIDLTRALQNSPNNNDPPNNSNPNPSPAPQNRSAAKITLIMLPLCLTVFLSALDLTIVTPAIPSIATSFASGAGYIWIGSAFILASTAITPIWGSVADVWGRKPILLIALAIFLGGSLLCALASSMGVLIAGRAVQGLGSSGMGTMVNVVICDSFSLRDRGLYLAITSLVWAVGSAVGPVIGGSFVTKLSWRWCFWINLPIGTLIFPILLFSLHLPSSHTPILTGLKAIDWPGTALILGAALALLLALSFGNVTFPWTSTTIIALFVSGAATLAIFVFTEWKFATNPVIPMRLFNNRSSVAAYAIWACNFYVLVGLSYYLPLYSQAVMGADALLSGVYLTPLIVSCSLAAACTGAFIMKTGVYLPLTYIAHGLLVLGTGLLVNLKVHESMAKLIVFQVITGMGVGMNIEPPLLAAQAALTALDTAVVQATMTFIRSLATTVAVVLGGVIFQNRMDSAASRALNDTLGEELARQFSGDRAAQNIELIGGLPFEQQDIVKGAYFASFRAVWIMFVTVSGISLLCGLFLRAHHLSGTLKETVLGVNRARNMQAIVEPQGAELHDRQESR